MFKHFIGHVYLFHDEPQEELPFVDIPVFSQDASNTPESLLIQLESKDLQEQSVERLAPFKSQSFLSLDVLKENIGIDLQSQVNLAVEFGSNPASLSEAGWTGLPTYKQLEFLCVLIWEYFMKGAGRVAGVSSGRQLALRINRLRIMSLAELIADEQKTTESIDEAVEGVLEFLRQWPQFRFGRLAMGVNRVQGEIAARRGAKIADYRFFVSQVENLFSDPSLMALDEYGVPFPLAKRFESYLVSDEGLDGTLDRLRRLNIGTLTASDFEKSVLVDAQASI